MARRLGWRMLAALYATGLAASACRAEEWPMQIPEAPSAHILSAEDAQGVWRVSSTAGDGECQISLVNAPLQKNYDVQVERCSLPLFASASAWRPTVGGFEIFGRDGRPLIRFRQTGVDAFISADDAYRLERASAS